MMVLLVVRFGATSPTLNLWNMMPQFRDIRFSPCKTAGTQ